MMRKAWSSIEEVPYCFSRSWVKFRGHTANKIVDFDPNCAFSDCNSSLNSPMAMKCCTKLETAKERCPIVFQGHPSNFKVTRDKTSPILTQIGRFRTIGRSQLSNPSDLPCSFTKWHLNNVVCKISAILFNPHRVNPFIVGEAVASEKSPALSTVVALLFVINVPKYRQPNGSHFVPVATGNKWLTFCRRYFEMYFPCGKCFCVELKFIEMGSWWSNWQ